MFHANILMHKKLPQSKSTFLKLDLKITKGIIK